MAAEAEKLHSRFLIGSKQALVASDLYTPAELRELVYRYYEGVEEVIVVTMEQHEAYSRAHKAQMEKRYREGMRMAIAYRASDRHQLRARHLVFARQARRGRRRRRTPGRRERRTGAGAGSRDPPEPPLPEPEPGAAGLVVVPAEAAT